MELIGRAIWAFFAFFFKRRPQRTRVRIHVPIKDQKPGPNHPYVLTFSRRVPSFINLALVNRFRAHPEIVVKEMFGWETENCGIKESRFIMHFYRTAYVRSVVDGQISFETRNDMILWKLKHQIKD